ncbi:sugar ABC transporter ATP-binding protein [Lactonifactor longoviformis]|uniref:sugar ABC transporter ATP-binding protein n=1 Tax=Lactonifactor longoviformis TaxID=341220 RepID=UPI0036F3B95D
MNGKPDAEAAVSGWICTWKQDGNSGVHDMKECQAILEMNHIYKQYSGITVLEDVTFRAYPGEVQVLLGANGAGKSTLMNIVSGVTACDRGRIYIGDREVCIRSAADAAREGIAMIHQELSLFQERSVYQNIFMGNERMKKNLPFWTDSKRMEEESRKVLEEMGFAINPGETVKNLSIAQQQIVEIAKAVWKRADILIMDEPTSSLTEAEVARLFCLIRRLKEQGCAIIYISHKLDELFRIGDRITVLFQGKVCLEESMKQVTKEQLVKSMSGKEVQRVKKVSCALPQEALRAVNLNGRRFRDCSFYVKKGEIVALTGMVGAGRSELVKAIFGADALRSGDIYLFGKRVSGRPSPSASIAGRIGFLPEERKQQGLIMGMDVGKNIVQADLPRLFPKRILSRKKERETARTFAGEVMYTQGIQRLPEKLSGGNQQKVVLAKWLCTDSDLLIFDEPTKGIDAAARAEIYQQILDLAGKGKGILLVSSDPAEVLQLSDRVYVMREGKICKELARSELTANKIVASEL